MFRSERFYNQQNRNRDTFLKIPSILFSRLETEKVMPTQQQRKCRKKRKDTSIFRLPVEIMAEIFMFAQLGSHGSFYNKYDCWCWITISHVCRRWRDIAIGTQELWSFIDTNKHASAEQTAVFLDRSGTSPLMVYHMYINDNFAQGLYLALAHMSRIRELYLWRAEFKVFPTKLYTLLSEVAAPSLQKFAFDSISSEDLDINTFFMGEPPKITSLAVCTSPPSWTNVSIMRNLKSLSIFNKTKGPTLRDIFVILSQNQHLRDFWLSSLSDDSLSNDNRSFLTPIRLPYLRYLEVLDATYTQLCPLVANVIGLQGEVGWDIQCKDYPFRDPKVAPKSIIPSVPLDKGYSSLHLSICPRNFVKIKADKRLKTKHRGNRYPSHRYLTYSWNGQHLIPQEERITTADLFVFICSIIKGDFWCFVSELGVEIETRPCSNHNRDMSGEIGSALWKQLLMMLPNLQEISITTVKSREKRKIEYVEKDYHDLLKALKSTREDKYGGRSIVCPKLSSLCLHGLDWENGSLYLMKCLLTRMLYVERLERIEIDCNLRKGARKGIREFIERSGVAREVHAY